jgi:arabinose-5-phosphate isomerase
VEAVGVSLGTKEDLKEAARRALLDEADALRSAAERIDERLVVATDLILRAGSARVIVTGLGKSGLIAQKLAATLSSTGTPALFLHPSEATHGDLGMVREGDPVLMISKSGTTAELVRLVHAFRDLRCPLIGILGNIASPLAREMDIVLDASVAREADPGGFVPTSSAIVALGLGHALTVALMQARGFGPAEFAHLHAGGQLGRNLKLRVQDVMHSGGEVAWVAPSDSLKQVVIAMSQRPLGAACVTDAKHVLLGIITDGDVRRALRTHDDIRTLTAEAAMTARPVTVDPHALLQDALSLMEDRPSQIYVLPVVDMEGTCCGLIRLHDIYQPGSAQD